jgi:hypothetical protein
MPVRLGSQPRRAFPLAGVALEPIWPKFGIKLGFSTSSVHPNKNGAKLAPFSNLQQ